MLSIVAGCSEATAPPVARVGVTTQQAPLPLRPKAAGAFAYTCQSGTSVDCLVFKGPKLFKSITANVKQPRGVAVGKDGRFYVADESAQEIFVFAAGGGSLLATLSDSGGKPVDVAVYQDQLAVSNTTSVSYYAKGATKPTRTLKDSSAKTGSGVAFDSKGNCYWSFVNTKSAAQVDEFAGCTGKAKNLNISPGKPYGLAFDGSGNLYYTSFTSSTQGVYKCSGVTSCAKAFSQFINPQYVNFGKGYKDLWLNDQGNYQSGTALYEIDIQTGKVIETITSGMSFFDPPNGVAAGPGPL